ncbi:hypothetical protein ASPWEDRAFT_45245 [Aspergillus wentii DTO 134E9]|uniref:Uncharacterized protein n=1 Tax=Aspergillus wentii DTO 134E9 TaxID=1073089 RepID=A0A1L9R8P0_ASPWE|nr:uncharacterized protein ASPWEDRAFT_45245 [Aspergillus wentii DTO 134E9]OJJ31291.1 hypothetical protein ASPWEDRAFT_45245 [Aspergillus wentii DTO 134E9]
MNQRQPKSSNFSNHLLFRDRMQEMYKTEVEVYEKLKDIQGKDIQLLACVTLSGSSQLNSEYAHIPGILME